MYLLKKVENKSIFKKIHAEEGKNQILQQNEVGERAIFPKNYEVEGEFIFVKDTIRAKKRFLRDLERQKKSLGNILPSEIYLTDEFEKDAVFEGFLKPVTDYDYDFSVSYLDKMIEFVTDFFKIKLPCENIAVFSEDENIVEKCTKYGKMVTVICERRARLGGDMMGSMMRGMMSCETLILNDGRSVCYKRKLKTVPELVVTDGRKSLSPVFKVPRINLGQNAEKSPMSLTDATICFKNSLFDFDISMGTLVYFLKKGVLVDYELTSFRKKAREVFTLNDFY